MNKLKSVLLFLFIFNFNSNFSFNFTLFVHNVYTPYIHCAFKLHIVLGTTLERMLKIGRNILKCVFFLNDCFGIFFSSNESKKQYTDYNRHNFG